jgi:outer membrane protein TolC
MSAREIKKIGLTFNVIFYLLFIFPSLARASEVKVLSLPDAIDLAMVQNPAVKTSSIQRVVDKFSLKLSYNNFAPQYNFVSSINQSANNDLTYAASPSISLKTQSGIGFGVNYHGVTSDGDFSQQAGMKVTVPLLRGAGYEINRVSLDNAIDQEEVNKLAYRDSVATVINNVQAQYFKVISDQKQREALKLSLQRSEATLAEYKIKVDAGNMPAANIAQQQSKIVGDKLQLESNSYSLKSDYRDLMLLLGMAPETKLSLDYSLDIASLHLPTLQEAIAIAKTGNYAYQQQLISMRSIKRSLLKAEDDNRPQLDLAGDISTDGDKSVGLTLTVPIHDMSLQYSLLSANSSLKQADIKLKQAGSDLVVATTNYLNNLTTQIQQIKLAKLNIKYAKLNYENANLSNLHGKTSAYEVVSQMQAYLQSEITLIDYQINYYTSYAEFNKFLGSTLDRWQINLIL